MSQADNFGGRYKYAGDETSTQFIKDWPVAKEKGWILVTVDKFNIYHLIAPSDYRQRAFAMTTNGEYVKLDENTLVLNWHHYYACDPEEEAKTKLRINSKIIHIDQSKEGKINNNDIGQDIKQCIPNEYCYCKHGICITDVLASQRFNKEKNRYEVYHGFMRHIALGKVPPQWEGRMTVATVKLPAGSCFK